MRILFLSYWGLDDPLTISTVIPHLGLLQDRADVEQVVLVTIERGVAAERPPQLRLLFAANKISFVSLCSRPGDNVLLTKIDDFVRFPCKLAELVQQQRCDFIIARGAPAGALAYLV